MVTPIFVVFVRLTNFVILVYHLCIKKSAEIAFSPLFF